MEIAVFRPVPPLGLVATLVKSAGCQDQFVLAAALVLQGITIKVIIPGKLAQLIRNAVPLTEK
jgi:hypothetical protein